MTALTGGQGTISHLGPKPPVVEWTKKESPVGLPVVHIGD